MGGPGPLRLFASTIDEPRSRRATDALLLGASLLGLGALTAVAEPVPRIVRVLGPVVDALPDLLVPLWQILADLLVLVAVVLLVAVAVRRRVAVLRDMGLALVVATAAVFVVGRAVGADWPDVWGALRAAGPPSHYPAPRLALCGAVLMTAAPHLTLPVRRLGRWIVGAGALATLALGTTTVLGAAAGLLVATLAASAVHLAVGSSAGRPGLHHVREGLAELGVSVTELGAADRQDAGLFRVEATTTDGAPALVKVYGRDAHDAALLTTVWRTAWYREAGAPLRVGRLAQVEHEAFVTLFVAQAGIPTDVVVTAGSTSTDDALLVLRRPGRVLADAALDEPERTVELVWRLVDRLDEIGVVHGRLDAASLLVVDGAEELGVVDLRGARLGTALGDRRSDVVQAFVTTLLLTDEDAAIEGAVRALGTVGVTEMLPLVQMSVLTPSQRRAVRTDGIDLDDLRARLAAAVGTDAPELVRLRRITLGTILRVGLPGVAILVLLSALSDLDLEELGGILSDASVALVVLGFVMTQLPRLTQAVSTLGASPIPLALGPVYALQLAVSFVNLAIPSSAARIGINIRFFQRLGVPPGAALAAGALDGVGGFVAQVTLLSLVLLLTSTSLDLDLGGAVDDATGALLVALIVAGIAITTVVAVGRFRRFVLEWARRLRQEAGTALRGLRSPRRLALLLGGNLATEILFALALGTFVRSLGYDLGLAELLLVNIGVALLAGLMPVPGGIGVAEGGLTFGLVQLGMPEEQALAAVLMYRLSSFYLPPIWGAVALRWLERNEHL